MPPTLTASLNPVDHPAFSPAWTAESYALQLSRHFGRTSSATAAATPPRGEGRIPYKFFAPPHPTSLSAITPTALRKDVAIDTNQPQTTHQYPPWSYYAFKNMPEPASDPPEIPTWVLGMLVGALTFLFVIAIVLFLAQFPPRLGWLRDIKHKWLAGYTRLSQEDHELKEGLVGGRSSAVASSTSRSRGGLKKRRPTLSIDTGVGTAYDGLGVVVPNEGDADTEGDWYTALQTRHSYDEEALCMPRRSPVALNWQSLTAPLPSIQTFGGSRGDSGDVESTSDIDAEAILSSRSAPPTIATPNFFRYVSQFDCDDDGDYLGSALLKRVNEGIYTAADKLSRAFYDQVNRPEEGLLLPVREGERERVLDGGVIVE